MPHLNICLRAPDPVLLFLSTSCLLQIILIKQWVVESVHASRLYLRRFPRGSCSSTFEKLPLIAGMSERANGSALSSAFESAD